MNSKFLFALAAILSACLLQAEPVSLPPGLTSDDWESVRAEYDRQRHAATETGAGYRARNLSQGWSIDFDGRGVQVVPDHGLWRWGLELAGYGYAGRAGKVDAPLETRAEVERVTYEWGGGLEEWFVNERRGLEHGFTLTRPPEGNGQAVEMHLRVRGAESARVDPDGRSASFGEAVRYEGLKAWDADGRELEARMEAVRDGLRIVVDVRGARYPVTVDPVAQQFYIKASNTDRGDHFGVSVALSGDTLAVGAQFEDGGGTGVNPNTQGDNSVVWSGAVYVFQRTAGSWQQQAYIKASNAGASDRFGEHVALSGDTLAVSAPYEGSSAVGVGSSGGSDELSPNSGAVYVFQRSGGIWAQEAYIKASNSEANDVFGASLALSEDVLAVGAPGEDSSSTGVNANGQSDKSTMESGAVYLFQRFSGVWTQQAYLKPSAPVAFGNFGISVALSRNTLAVGSSGAASGCGAVYIFRSAGGLWTEQAYVIASNAGPQDGFGFGLALDGPTMVVGAIGESSAGQGVNPGAQADNSAPYSGAAYVFEEAGGIWSQKAYIKASNAGALDYFGVSISLSGDALAVAASNEDGAGKGIDSEQQSILQVSDSGAVYLFRRDAGAWSETAYIKASNAGDQDSFGYGVAISGHTLAVGAPSEDGFGPGINSRQDTPTRPGSGAAYLFGISPTGAAGVGVYSDGRWLLDRNANGVFDPGKDLDFLFGFEGATPIVGDWNGDGLKQVGLFKDGFWFLDHDGNGAWDGGVVDKQHEFGWAGVTPMIGDWNGDGRETIGIYINGFWFLDVDGGGVWDGPGVDIGTEFGWTGVAPITGDWNGDGRDKIGISVRGFWYADYDGNGRWDGPSVDRVAHFGSLASPAPLVGDWDGDGRDDIGLATLFSASEQSALDGLKEGLSARYFPYLWTRVIGDWDGDGREEIGFFQDGEWYLDLDRDGTISAPSYDKHYLFGQAGDVPFVGPW